MKVLMFGWEFPPHISGGLGTACRGMTRALSSFPDIEITFVVPKIRGDEDEVNANLLGANEIQVVKSPLNFPDQESKIQYYYLKSGLIPYLGTSEFEELVPKFPSGEKRLVETTSDGKMIFTGKYGPTLFQEIESYAVVAETLARKLDFDVIHVHDWMTFPAGMAVKRFSGKPLVLHIHSTEFDRSGEQVNPFICETEKKGMDFADKIIAVSNFTRNLIIQKYFIEPEKVVTVFNAVESFHIEKGLIHLRTGKEKRVIFLGRITHQKGPEYFVEAARLVLQKMQNVRFVMAGKGDLRDRMIEKAVELNISDHFEFPGFIADNEVFNLLVSGDVFVMPSVSEPFGIVALEAMQAGLPVVISRQSGASELIKNAIKVDYWNVQAMADSIFELLTDLELKNQLSISGKKEARKLNWQNSAAKIRRIYLGLVPISH